MLPHEAQGGCCKDSCMLSRSLCVGTLRALSASGSCEAARKYPCSTQLEAARSGGNTDFTVKPQVLSVIQKLQNTCLYACCLKVGAARMFACCRSLCGTLRALSVSGSCEATHKYPCSTQLETAWLGRLLI